MAENSRLAKLHIAPQQIVIFTDDAVSVIYADGSKLSISPCGSTVTHIEPRLAENHPLTGEKFSQHRTQYITSSYKSKVAEGLEFRNMFAERPFICKDLWTKCSVLKLHAEIDAVLWPNTLEPGSINTLPDGSVRITSLCECASINLLPHKQGFTLQYLGKVSSNATRLKTNTSTIQIVKETTNKDCGLNQQVKIDHSINSSCAKHMEIVSPKKIQHSENILDMSELSLSGINESHIVASSPLSERTKSRIDKGASQKYDQLKFDESVTDEPIKHTGSGLGIIGEGYWEYVWVDQHYSFYDYPQHFKPVIDLLLNNQKEKGEAASKVKEKMKLKTSLPITLPLSCNAQHLHNKSRGKGILETPKKSEIPEFEGRPKVVCVQGVLYRLLWKSPRAVEILPGDGSLMRSSSLSGHFFQHYIWNKGQVEERTYSVETPPPTPPGALYSIKKLIERGARFLELLYNSEMKLGEDETVCWKVSRNININIPDLVPTFLLEECSVENIGRFSAYSSGRIRIMFTDRTCLEMWCDLSDRLYRCSSHGIEQLDEKHDHQSICPPPDLPLGLVRLLLPDGHYHTVTVSDPHQYSHYISFALHWAAWVNSEPSERFDFYKDTINDPEKVLSIEQEILKIRCFNYLLDSGVTPHFTDNATEQIEKIHVSNSSKKGDTNFLASSTCVGHEMNKDNLDFHSVQLILQKTSNAVKDLDSFLETAHK